MELSIIEVILWVLQKVSAAAEPARNELIISDLLFFGYVVISLVLRKGCYLAAFFIVETVGYLNFYDSIGAHVRFLLYVLCYSLIYKFGSINNWKIKTLFGYVIMILFQLLMVRDAYIFPEVETFLYQYYEYIILVIHVYIMSTLFRWQDVRKCMGDFFSDLRAFYSANYNLSFYWYNTFNK